MSEFWLVQQQYATRLRRALELAAEKWSFIEGLEIKPICPEALNQFDADWRGHSDRIADWNWRDSDMRVPKGINLAVWRGGTLCGLASGKLTNSKAVRLDWIEGRPGGHPLKGDIIPIVLTCADAYRIEIGSKELRLYRVIEDLIPVYEEFGFELVSEDQRVHVMRKVTQ